MITHSSNEVRAAVSYRGCCEVGRPQPGGAGCGRCSCMAGIVVVAGIGDPGAPSNRNRPASTMPATGHANFAGVLGGEHRFGLRSRRRGIAALKSSPRDESVRLADADMSAHSKSHP